MKKDGDSSTGTIYFYQNKFIIAAYILLTLTLISFSLVSSLYARYSSGEEETDSARVAQTGSVAIYEHKAVLNNGVYQLDENTVVTGNVYEVVVPGMEIPKDAYVHIDGSHEVAYEVYIEVASDNSDVINYNINTEVWKTSDEIAPRYGGTIYKYHKTISANQTMDIGIFKNDTLKISDTLKDKSDPTLHSGTFYVNIYGYLVQKD